MDEDRKHPRATRVGALRDLLAISLTALALFVLGSVTDAFESVHAALQRHGPGTEDDVLLALVLIVFASCAFGLLTRRRAGRPAANHAIDDGERWERDPTGLPTLIQDAMQDVTESQQAEEKLREAEARYRTLVERLPAVVYIDALDDVSTALYVSPRYEQLLGYTAEERMADPEMWLRLIHPDDQRWVQAESKRTNETGDPFIVEYRMLAKDGRVVWVRDEAVIVRDESGAPLHWQGVLLDITKRKQAEEGLSRRDGILEAVGFAAERFLKTHRWEETIPPVLERLGSAAGVSRAYLFENRVREDGERSTALRFEWTASGIGPSINEPNHARTTYRENGFGRWEDVLSAGGVICGLPRGFPESERPELAMEGILSMAVVPVFVGEDWWGFLGFDECLTEREWPAAELDALRTAADTLGAAIGRERAERLQAETEARYRSLVENLPAVTYVDIVDEKSTTIYVSPQVEEILGYATQEWLADDELWVRNLYPDDRDQIVEAARQHNTIGEPFDVEYRFRAKDGRWLWIHDEATIERDHAGRPRFSQGVMFDITERRAAEEQLRETEAKYRALVEHIPAVLYVDPADPDGPTMYVSPQAEEVLGIDRERYLADPGYWLEMIDAEDRERILEAYHDSLERREGWAVEYRIIRPSDGHVIWLRDESAYLPGGEGRPDLVQGVMADITERKLAEEALQQSERREREAAERLRALDEMKNTFLAAVSHELRSPLTSILGLSLTLEQQDLTAEDRGDLLGRLASNSRKLDRLLKDLLDIDRLNRGIVTPQYRATDVGALVRRTVDSLDILADRSVLVEAEAVVVPVDPAKVERIVENLLANAVRHTSADSGIWVLVVPQDGGVQISVEDDGSGVPKELQQAIFEPFLQGPTASPHSPGTGIGLSLVALFAELHGGRAWVEDREGGGASFRVFLPGTPSNGEPRALRQEPAVGSGTRG
jgi:two-component system, cell cycle sensor histidine kinase and response regulator CckA